MKRRDILLHGGAAAGLGSGLLETGCAHGPAAAAEPPLPDPAFVASICSSLDQRCAWIDQHQLAGDLAPALRQPFTPDEAAKAARYDRLFRTSIRTMYLTGRFLDLPDEIKVHPDVQARMWAAQPQMDEAILGTTELLESLTPADHRDIQRLLRERPEIGEQLAVLMEEPAREDGIPFKRRLGLRRTTTDLATRLAAQSPALTIDPYVRRVRKIEARRQTPSEGTRRLAARVGQEAFWQHQERLAAIATRWRQQLAQNQGSAPAPTPAPAATTPAPAKPEEARKPGSAQLRVGGWMMGLGGGSVALGLIFAGINSIANTSAFTTPALIFGVTIGPILLILGLIVILAGLLIRAGS